MTDRYDYLVVVLDKYYRSDDAKKLMQAILQLKGVIDVQPNVVKPEDYVTKRKVQIEMEKRLYKALHDGSEEEG